MNKERVEHALGVIWGWAQWTEDVLRMIGIPQLPPIKQIKDAVSAIKEEVGL